MLNQLLADRFNPDVKECGIERLSERERDRELNSSEMDEKQAKVHNTNKSKHRRGASSRGNITEPTSPTITATTAAVPQPPPAAAATTTQTTTTPIVIVQSQSNDDEIADSPASSVNVNSKNVQSSGVADIGMHRIQFSITV